MLYIYPVHCKKHNFPCIIDFTEFLCIFQNGQETYNYKKRHQIYGLFLAHLQFFYGIFPGMLEMDSLGGLVGDIFLRDRNVTVLMKCA